MSGLNLRVDLARLSDPELAKHLEATIEGIETTKPTYGTWFRLRGRRGPIRHPTAYKLFLLLAEVEWWKRSRWNRGGTGRLHLLECELQDIHDEIAERLAKRRAQGHDHSLTHP